LRTAQQLLTPPVIKQICEDHHILQLAELHCSD
jgi:hypothetical protein